MRIEDVFHYSQPQTVNEAPYGMGSKLKDKAIGKAKGVFGGGQREQGNVEAGERANQMYNEFKRYVGRVAGPKQKSIDAQHLKAFLNGKKMDAAIVDRQDDDLVTPSDAQKYILAAVRKSMQYASAEQPTSAAPQQAPQEQPRQQQPKAAPTAEQDPEQPAVKPSGAYEPDTEHEAKSTSTAGPDFSEKLSQLSPGQRKKLISILTATL